MTHIAAELKRASFDVNDLRAMIYGSKENYAIIKKCEAAFDNDPLFQHCEEEYFLPREEQVKKAVARGLQSIRILKKNPDYLSMHSPLHGAQSGNYAPAQRVSANHCGVTDHFALFCQTLLTQCNAAQTKEWLMRAIRLEIIGTYAQTELGHGSNIRALQTTATFEKETDTILINMPDITAMKWWPGALGLLATHAVIYARLLVDGVDHGFNAFMVQIRDENHKPMGGVEVGDLGPKIGDNTQDGGYLYLKNVRIPRFNMLAKFQQLDRDGKFHKVAPHLAKIAYATMMKARTTIIRGAGGQLARGCVIAIRYNAFRKQGFLDSKKGLAGGERTILDYTIQQARILPALAAAWTMLIATNFLQLQMEAFEAGVKKAGKDVLKVDTSMIPELHATSSGLKAFCTEISLFHLEDVRRCCGGHGYAMYSGIAGLYLDALPMVTYEGDRHPMALQCARAVMGALAGKIKKTESFKHFGYMNRATALSKPRDLAHLVKVWEGVSNTSALNAGKALLSAQKRLKSQDKAWNACHIQLFRAAHSYCMLFLVKGMFEGIKTAPPAVKKVFHNMGCLFALGKLSEASVSDSKIGDKQAKLIDNATRDLLADLRPESMALVEAFGFSDRTLHTKLAPNADDAYERIYNFAKACPLNKPEYVESIRKDSLEPFLNKEYLAKGNKSRL